MKGSTMPSAYKTEVLPGFPVEFVFNTKDELDEYMNGDKIQCLRCGRYFRGLGQHLWVAHGMRSVEYKEIYGIPWRRGLTCSETYNIRSKVMKRAYSERDVPLSTPERRALAHKAKHRKAQPLVLDMMSKRVKEYNISQGHDGTEQRRRDAAPKVGTPEHTENLRNRRQCIQFGKKYNKWWKDKRQSPEHLRKRMESSARTREAKEKDEG